MHAKGWLAILLPGTVIAASNPHLEFGIQSLRGPDIHLSALSGKLTLGEDGHSLRLAPFALRLGDAPLRGKAQVDLRPPHPWRLQATGHQLDLETFTATLRLPWRSRGRLDLDLDLKAPALPRRMPLQALSGHMRLAGRDIELEGMDLDKLLDRLQKNQDAGLVGLGVLALTGPAGALVVKATNYEKLARLAKTQGTSRLRAFHSEVTLKAGRIEARDVALATAHHLLAVKGWVDFGAAAQAPGGDPDATLALDFALVNERGCALYEEQVRGTLKAPEVIHAGRMVKELLSPVTSLLGKIPKTLGIQCEQPFYQGRLLRR